MKFNQKLVVVCVVIVLSAANVFGAHRHKKADPKDAEITRLNALINQKDLLLNQNAQDLKQKDTQLTQKVQQLTQKDAELITLRSKVAELTGKLDQFKICIAHCIEQELLLKKAQDDALLKQQDTKTTQSEKTGLALLVEDVIAGFESPFYNVN